MWASPVVVSDFRAGMNCRSTHDGVTAAQSLRLVWRKLYAFRSGASVRGCDGGRDVPRRSEDAAVPAEAKLDGSCSGVPAWLVLRPFGGVLRGRGRRSCALIAGRAA